MNDAIRQFWDCFLSRKSDLERLGSTDDPVYTDILLMLKRIDSDLWLEFCTSPGINEIIISADGKESLFPLVEEIVRNAPEVPDWKIFALKPQLGFPLTTKWESVKITISDVLVLPVSNKSGDIGLRMYVPALDESNSHDLHSALLRALDAGLGERRFAESVQATWVYPLSDAPFHAFPLPRLPDHLEQRPMKG